MSPADPTITRLPDELIIEIFGDKTLSPHDLRNCSLVSRNFVGSVNRFLYSDLKAELVELPSEADEASGVYDYTLSTWKLLRTLGEQERLSKHVQRLEFHTTYGRRQSSGVRTSRTEALSTFLSLATEVKHLFFDDQWYLYPAHYTILKDSKSVESLIQLDQEENNVVLCAQEMPFLRHIGGYLSLSHQPHLTARFSSLRSLTIFGGFNSAAQFPSLMASSPTLQYLGINLDLALDLDYSQFPVLQELFLGEIELEGPSNQRHLISHRATNFWESLCKSPSLQTLALSQDRYSNSYEEVLFESKDDRPVGPLKPIPTLRTLRFDYGIQLDRACFLLSGPFATTLRRVVVPSPFADSSSHLISDIQYKAVTAMCETKGMELVLAESPNVFSSFRATIDLRIFPSFFILINFSLLSLPPSISIPPITLVAFPELLNLISPNRLSFSIDLDTSP